MSISVVVITQNEALNLPGFLACLGNWVDEIIVVDDNSTDETLQICRRSDLGIRVITSPMNPELGFAGQRNKGLQAAKSEWVLHLDCDERVTPALRDEILSLTRLSTYQAFRYRRLNYFLNRPMRHGGWNTWNYPQLARRGIHHFEGRLHERCIIQAEDTEIGQLQAPMHHLNDHDYRHRLQKSMRYTVMESERIRALEKKVSALSILGSSIKVFVKKYFYQRGFLDGTPGLISALHSASAIMRAYALAWDEQNEIARDELECSVQEIGQIR